MRLMTRKVWRAFPELDRFSDDRCRAFVSAATKATPQLMLASLLLAVFGMSMLCSAGLVTIRIFERIQVAQRSTAGEVIGWVLAIIMFVVLGAIGACVFLVVRDALLRLAIRRVIHTLGRCVVCRYTLLGLPIGGDNSVICPECGLQTEVNPALATLSEDADGVRRLQAVNVPASRKPFWTPRRVAIVRRTGIAAGVLILIGASGWGCWAMIRAILFERQARLAAAERPTSQMWDDVRAKYVAPLSPGEPDATTLIDTAGAALKVVSDKAWNASPSSGEYPSLWWWYGDEERADAAEGAPSKSNKARGVALLADARAAGVFDQMRELVTCRTGENVITVLPTEPVWLADRGTLKSVRDLARVNAARMQLAIETGENREFADALEAGIALARLAGQRDGLSGYMTFIEIEREMFDRVFAALERHSEAAWIDTIEGVLKQQPAPPNPRMSIELDKLLLLDCICWVYGRGREAEVRTAIGLALDRRSGPALSTFGWFEESREDLERKSSILDEQVPRPARDRDWDALAWLYDRQEELLSRRLMASYREFVLAVDAHAIGRSAVWTALAVARFRGEHGREPESLDELGERRLASLPLDPWSGRPLGYKRIDPDVDPQGRHYLLYSVGSDRTDDHGRPWMGPYMPGRGILLPGVGTGADFIANDQRR
ncbi:MAG: hypothetical protein ACREJO_00905 [Phycisphaerales bacterium]